MSPQRRTLTSAFALSLAFLSLAARASAGVTLRGVDASGYPAITFSVVAPTANGRAPHVQEDGRRVFGVQTVNLGRSKSVVLAVDRSRSMRGQSLTDASAAAAAFVAAKPAADRVAVVAFGSKPVSLTGFSTATIDADDALRAIDVDRRQGTALYDAIVVSAQKLAAQANGGRVIIVLTDGKDVSSSATLDGAIAAAHAAGVAVYPIAIAGPQFDPRPLQRLAAATGGSFASTTSTSTLAAVYSSIGSQLARTWRVRYFTAARPGDRLSLHVTLPGQGAVTHEVALPHVAGAPAPPAPSRLLPRSFYTTTAGTLLVALAAALDVLLVLGLLRGAKKALWVKTRLEPHIAGARRGRRRRSRDDRFAMLSTLFRATERALGHLRQWRALQRLLERADLPLRAAEFLYIALGSAALLGLVFGIATRSGIGFLAGAGLGASVPLGVVWLKAKKRLGAFENQLPDLLVTLAASLKAGHSFRHGIQTVVDEGQAPASDEFKRVLTDTQLGRPMEDSLEEMAQRVGSKNFEFVITAVTIQRQVGGSLAALFDMVADTVRQRQQFARRIKSLTAMGRMSAYVLVALPFFLGLVLTVLNRQYMSPLFTTSTGHLLIGAGLGMMAFGSLILKKIVSFRG